MAEQEKLRIHGLRGELRLKEPMKKHTSWRTGGAAERFYIPADLNDLGSFLRTLPPQEPLTWVGLGSNLLVRDGGIRGTVIFTHGALKEMRLLESDVVTNSVPHSPLTIYAEAGVAGAKVARHAARHELEGGEFLAGIPGTVGGALAMNAGCFGSETWDIVERVLTVARKGVLRQRTAADYEIDYRHVALLKPQSSNLNPEEWFAAAWFKLAPGDGHASQQKIKSLLTRRIQTQPLNLPNAGSVFRNPRGDYAARLIEGCGLKGLRIGGALVSPKHANFIVNCGAASAADIETVIETLEQTVRQKTGVALEREVRIIGEAL